jgi:cell wall-associated NlpC family hydrolase
MAVLVVVGAIVSCASALAAGASQLSATFPASVETGAVISVEAHAPAKMRLATLVLQQRDGNRWKVRAQAKALRSGGVNLSFAAPSAPGVLSLRVEASRHGHRLGAFEYGRVTVDSRPQTLSVSGPTCPPGDTGSTPNCQTPAPNPDHGAVLSSGETLDAGSYLESPNGSYRLIMQGDGNLVLYEGAVTCATSCSGDAIWNSGTDGDDGASVTMQPDGNLVVYYNGTAVWNSNTWGFSGDYLELQDDDNLVIYQHSHPVWDWGSGDIGDLLEPGTTLVPGDELISPGRGYQLIMQGDGNLVLYQGGVTCPSASCSGTALWSSGTDGANGATVTMQPDGNLVVYYNGTAVWNSNTGGFPGAFLKLQDDDNLVIYQGGTAIWDWASGRLSPGGGGAGGSKGQAIVAAAQSIQSQSYPQQSFSSAHYIYCFDGGTTSGATAGGNDAEGSDGSYSNCNSIGRTGFDCRGLTLYAVYQGTGGAVSLPTSTAGAQYSEASSYGGSYISLSALQPGDLVFFGSSSSAIDHVGIVVSGTGSSAEIISAISEHYGIATETIHWFQGEFSWVGAVAIPGV